MLQKIKGITFNEHIAIFLSGLLGIIVFLLIYGPYTLNVCEDAWILHQFDGPDIIQNYAGWTQFRISEWGFPLGYANMMAYGDGTYITYTDSIPYVAIICKLFAGILPETFQYFGWFTLGCFALQGIGAGLLIMRKYHSYWKIVVGDVFFLVAPILIERTFKHTALGAQWFILFALYYYLEYRSRKDAKLPWEMLLLCALTVGIHPYFLPMVMIFVLLIIIEALLRRYVMWKTLVYTALSVVLPYGLGVVIGVLGTGIKNTREGYGIFGINLNTLFNPKSYGGFTWSHILTQRSQALATYEGFNYLGLGILLMAGVCGIFIIYELLKDKNYIFKMLQVVKRNMPLLLCMLFMTLFAMTNNITWDEKVLVTIPFSKELVELASLFRASGRMFYPVYYLIMLSLIYYILGSTGKKLRVTLLVLLLIIQIYDMRDVYTVKHNLIKENYYKETIMDDEVLAEIIDKEVLVFVGTDNFETQRSLAVWAAARDMGICYSIANTGEYKNCDMFATGFSENISNGLIQKEIVYATIDVDVIQNWRAILEEKGKEYVEYQRGNCYFVYTANQ